MSTACATCLNVRQVHAAPCQHNVNMTTCSSTKTAAKCNRGLALQPHPLPRPPVLAWTVLASAAHIHSFLSFSYSHQSHMTRMHPHKPFHVKPDISETMHHTHAGTSPAFFFLFS